MTFPAEFSDLVSTEGLKKRPQVQQSPLDSVQFWLTPASAESATVADNLQRAALTELLAPTGQLRKAVPQAPETETVFTAPRATAELAKLAGRLGKAWESKKHRPKIQAIIDKFKAAPMWEPLKNNPDAETVWDELVTSAVNAVCDAIHAEAA
jgi:hypothetical protein